MKDGARGVRDTTADPDVDPVPDHGPTLSLSPDFGPTHVLSLNPVPDP